MSDQRWWQDWRWVLGAAGCLLGVALLLFAIATWRGSDRIDSNTAATGNNTEVVAQLKTLADDNKQTLDRLDKNQVGIDALVQFVNDLKARPQDPQTAAALKAIIDTEKILCTSPQFTDQCRAVGVPAG